MHKFFNSRGQKNSYFVLLTYISI